MDTPNEETMTDTKKRRRTPEERAADLDRKAEEIRKAAYAKARLDEKRATKLYRAMRTALNGLDVALAESYSGNSDGPQSELHRMIDVARDTLAHAVEEYGIPFPMPRALANGMEAEESS